MAQWLERRILDQGVPGSNPGRCAFCCGLEHVTFIPCLVLVKPRKRWMDDRIANFTPTFPEICREAPNDFRIKIIDQSKLTAKK